MDPKEKNSDMPEVIKAFIESTVPPEGQGGAYFKVDWKIFITLILYVPYACALLGTHSAYWGLFFYSCALVLFFGMMIAKFKEHMAFVSNPFDFVQVQFGMLVNAVIAFGLGYAALSKLNPQYFSQTLSWFEGVYFSVITIATIGYGDISPIGVLPRVAVIFEVFFGVWFFVTVVPVAVADQAERIRHFRAGRRRIAEAVKSSWEGGELQVSASPGKRYDEQA